MRDRRQRLLLSLARAGSERAFRRLYGELYGPVMGYLAARLASREDAEDLCSVIFMRFLRRLDRFDPDRGSVLGWILAMARHATIDHYRAQRPTESRNLSLEESAAEIEAPDSDALQLLIDDESAQLLHGVLRAESAELREMFSLRFAQGLRYAEIAQHMGLSESAVKQRFSRTMRELRRKLERQRNKGGANHADWQAERNPQESA